MRRHQYASAREKRVDLWLGFGGWFVINVPVIYLIQATSSSHPTRAFYLQGLLGLLNLAAPIVLGFTRSYAAFGILLAWAAGLCLVVVEGVFFTVSDFIAYSPTGLTAVNYGFLAAGLLIVAVGAFLVVRATSRSIK